MDYSHAMAVAGGLDFAEFSDVESLEDTACCGDDESTGRLHWLRGGDRDAAHATLAASVHRLLAVDAGRLEGILTGKM